jgi:transposase-like protein
MAKNKIQFQKGLSLTQFLSQYGTDEQCRSVLFKMRWPQGFVCPLCGHKRYCEIKQRKVFQCYCCRQQTSLTSGTIFDNTKLGLNIWFLAIYLMTQSKDGISSLNLSRTIGVSANAALRMKHKLQHVMKKREDAKRLSGLIQIDDSYLGGKSRGGKRGRGASGKIPFVAAVATDEKGHPLQMRFSQVKSFSKHEISQWAKKHLAPGSIVVSDGYRCFTGIKNAGCSHQSIITGGGPDSVEIKEFRWVNTMLGNVKNAIRGSYHAISEKHIPRYLAEFCYRFNRRFNLKEMVRRLAYVALQTPPVPVRILKLAETRW